MGTEESKGPGESEGSKESDESKESEGSKGPRQINVVKVKKTSVNNEYEGVYRSGIHIKRAILLLDLLEYQKA
ncbi:hypothetical protein [Paenibacillus typhae]|uniref:hypothetical protein n=1 Tax=Paenibacillus typhae TaxID=1174501 RepID=UPI001C8E27E5|nr:hypothetical protein [Paenibacillus typhae]